MALQCKLPTVNQIQFLYNVYFQLLLMGSFKFTSDVPQQQLLAMVN